MTLHDQITPGMIIKPPHENMNGVKLQNMPIIIIIVSHSYKF